jgi:hypothetical protein
MMGRTTLLPAFEAVDDDENLLSVLNRETVVPAHRARAMLAGMTVTTDFVDDSQDRNIELLRIVI